MYAGSHEWLPPGGDAGPEAHPLAPADTQAAQSLYGALSQPQPDEAARSAAREMLHAEIAALRNAPPELPDTPADLLGWMQSNVTQVHAAFAMYLEGRKAGGPRRYFSSRAHALYFLRNAAPTKLVDGSWLYGLVEHWRNPRWAPLVRTYLEELGDGDPDHNHVLLYRNLLERHGLATLDGLPDAMYRQGAVQLALGWNAQEFLPEVVGFNLGYEQLPLHLLITAYELDEIGIDPYYFTLHVTVDNADTGHARRACEAAVAALPRLDDGGKFWARMQDGARLACAGTGTTAIIEGFDIDAEALRILQHKAGAGCGAHSDYCRIGGRHVNDWLSQPEALPQFLQALQDANWLRRGEEPSASRFWNLLQGPRATMFGVFSSYELQVLHDWIRGDAAADARAWDAAPGAPVRSFRALQRLAPQPPVGAAAVQALDSDTEVLREQLSGAQGDERLDVMAHAISPALHWLPPGLHATAQFAHALGGVAAPAR